MRWLRWRMQPQRPLFQRQYFVFTEEYVRAMTYRGARQAHGHSCSMLALASTIFASDEKHLSTCVVLVMVGLGDVEVVTKVPLTDETKANIENIRPIGVRLTYVIAM